MNNCYEDVITIDNPPDRYTYMAEKSGGTLELRNRGNWVLESNSLNINSNCFFYKDEVFELAMILLKYYANMN